MCKWKQAVNRNSPCNCRLSKTEKNKFSTLRINPRAGGLWPKISGWSPLQTLWPKMAKRKEGMITMFEDMNSTRNSPLPTYQADKMEPSSTVHERSHNSLLQTQPLKSTPFSPDKAWGNRWEIIKNKSEQRAAAQINREELETQIKSQIHRYSLPAKESEQLNRSQSTAYMCKWKQAVNRNSQAQFFRSDQLLRPTGHFAWTVFHPTLRPDSTSLRDGQSAGLASVETRSMKTRIRRVKTKSQNTEISEHRSSLLEYPLINAASTASESMSKMRSVP